MSMPVVKVIDDEARILSKYSNDLDNFRRFYSLKETTSDEEILIQFVAPKIIAFEDYRFCLLQNSQTKVLSPSRYYRPDYVSYDEYGTTNLWALIMFINEVPTLEDFTLENILIPTTAIINQISTDILKRDLLKELVPLRDYPPKPTSPLFSRQKAIPTYAPETTPIYVPTTLFMRELFTVDVIMARERFVDLQYEPVNETVLLKVDGAPNYLYDKHYTMIRGNKGMNRLTWDPRKIPNGVGLMSVLVEGVDFEVTYERVLTTAAPTLEQTVIKAMNDNPAATVDALQYPSLIPPTSDWDMSDTSQVGRKFVIGSLVYDEKTGVLYRCADPTPGAAVWNVMPQERP